MLKKRSGNCQEIEQYIKTENPTTVAKPQEHNGNGKVGSPRLLAPRPYGSCLDGFHGGAAGGAGDERRRHRRAGAPLPRRPARRPGALPRPRLRARHVSPLPSPSPSSSPLPSVLFLVSLLLWEDSAAGKRENALVVDGDFWEEGLGEKKNRWKKFGDCNLLKKVEEFCVGKHGTARHIVLWMWNLIRNSTISA